MALATNADLEAAVANWLDDTGLSARIPEFIRLGEAMIWRKVRNRATEASETITINAQTVALPTRFLEQRRLYISDSLAPPVFFTPEDFWARYFSTNATGRPIAYTVEGNNLVFGPTPDSSYSGRVLFYQRPTAMADEVPTLFTENPDLYLYAALVQSAPFLVDDSRLITWGGMLQQILDDIEKANRRDRTGARPLIARSDVPKT
jgi:hypothetical protein